LEIADGKIVEKNEKNKGNAHENELGAGYGGGFVDGRRFGCPAEDR
jgi:hypothetical protein